ncbi:MAG: hypothetical protein ACYDAK_06050 [Candidatus Limnocylindrales bacterium]
MTLIMRVEVTPYNDQVELSDPNARAYPRQHEETTKGRSPFEVCVGRSRSRVEEFYELPTAAGRHQVQVLISPVGDPAKVVYLVLD